MKPRNQQSELTFQLLLNKIAMEFPSPNALKEYLKEHPGADRSRHKVKKPSGGGSGGGKAKFNGENPQGDPQDRSVSDMRGMKNDIFVDSGGASFADQARSLGKLHPPSKLKKGLKESLPWMSKGEMKDLHKKIENATHSTTKMKRRLGDEIRAKAEAGESKHPGMILTDQVDDAVKALISGKSHDGDLFNYIDKPDDVPGKLQKAETKDKGYREIADWMATEARKYLKGGGKQAAQYNLRRRLSYLRKKQARNNRNVLR